jgi:DNA mismatch repair protein MutS2
MIERFAATGTWGVATTHLGSLKRLGAETAGVASGSLEFDVETFTSRYRFLPGVPGASHALAVAERLGFPAEVLERARNLTPEEAKAVERLAAALAAAHAAALAERSELERARRAAEGEAAGHREAVERVQREWAERRRALRREGEDLLSRARGLWQTLEREARRREMKREELRPVLDELRSAEGELDAMSGPEPEAGSGVPIPADALVPGARVRVADLGVEAEVVAAPDAEGRVQLRRGHWTIQSHVSKLRPVAPAGPPQVPGRPEHGARATWTLAESAPALEVDLRGMDVDEALTELDRGLDRAVVSGLGEIRVVHGIGRGILRAAVERHLRGHPHVTDQRLGQVGEGGRGVTVVKLR